jgi:hypothetical protein
MAKLIVDLNLNFKTDRSLITEDFSAKTIEGLEFGKRCEAMDRSKLGILIGATNEEHQVDFLFYPKGASKLSRLSIAERVDMKGFNVSACGEFASPGLRAGVTKFLEPIMDSLDLRIKGIVYDGGMYSGEYGLTSWVEGGDYEETTDNWAKTFPFVEHWRFA